MNADTGGVFDSMDEERFNELYAAYASDVLRVCCYYLGDRGKAEDITQEVFLKLLKTNPVLIPGKEKSWLLAVALNCCRDYWRSGWFRRVVVNSPILERKRAEDVLDAAVEREELKAAIRRLVPRYREVILLFYYQGFSTQEIADAMHLPLGTISSRLSRGREKLQELLGGKGE